MGRLAKLKTTLEWMRLAKFVADIFVAIASWKAVKKLLTHVPQNIRGLGLHYRLVCGSPYLVRPRLVAATNKPIGTEDNGCCDRITPKGRSYTE
jgi:hypothetical protein